MTKRFTELADKSLSEADMLVRMDKTYSHHVCRGGDVQVTEAEIKKANEKLEFACDFCKRKFATKRGMKIHRASCIYQYTATEERYVIEDILDVFGKVEARWYLVKFEGYEKPEWQRGHLLEIDAKDAVRHYWTKSGRSPCEEFYPDPDNLHRCTICAKTYKRQQDLKAHRTRTKHYDNTQEKISPAAERKAKEAKKEELQAKLPNVMWGSTPAENCWQFEYLGSIIQADGKQMPDRCATEGGHGQAAARKDEARVGLEQTARLVEAAALHRRCVLGDGVRLRDVDTDASGTETAERGEQPNGGQDHGQHDQGGGLSSHQDV